MGNVPGDDDSSEEEHCTRPSTASEKALLNRRGALGVGAAFLGGIAFLEAVDTAAAAVDRYGITFDRVVDAVDDLGMDPTGGEPIDGALDGAYRTGTLVEFPPGDYLVTDTHVWNDGVSRFGMVGTGDSHKDVQFVFPPGNNGDKFRFISSTSGSHHLLANLSIQQTMDDTTSADIWFAHSDGSLIQDVEWLGRTPTDNDHRRQLLGFDCTTTDGVMTLRRVYMRESAVLPGYPDGVAGIRVGAGHDGEILMEDCHIEQRGSSSFRSTHGSGVLHVKGGLFKNNDNTNMRIAAGDHPSKVSWIKGAKLVVDADNLNEYAKDGDRLESPEGLRVDATGNGYTGVVIEDCEFVYKSAPGSRGIVTVPSWSDHGSFVMRNCSIVNDAGVQTIHAQDADTGSITPPYGPVLDGVHIEGSSSSQPRGCVVAIDADRDDTDIRNTCIHFPDADTDGVHISGSRNCNVSDSMIDVGGRATVFDGSDVTSSNITTDGVCVNDSGTSDGTDDSGSGGTDDSSGSDGSDDGDSGDTTPSNTLEIVGKGVTTNYRFTVDEALEGADDLESWDAISGTSADGWITTEGATDTYYFDSEITDLAIVQGDADVLVNGSPLEGSSRPENTIEVRGVGLESHYAFSVSGALEAGDDVESDDAVSDGTADGWISDGVDTFYFDGEITGFDVLQGDVDVVVNGSEVDLGRPPNVLEVVGRGTTTNYQFSVTDALEGADDLESWDAISGTSADGWITTEGATDTYYFAGELTSFEFARGDADVLVNGSPLDVGRPAKTLAIEGNGTPTHYRFGVSETLEAGPDLESEDAVDGTTAEGRVDGDTDTFYFDGEITSFEFLEGEANVYRDGELLDTAVFALPNVIEFDGTGSSGATSYSFGVSGEVDDDYLAGAAEDGDAIDGGSVTGTVDGDVDAFRFSGDLVSLQVDGSASLTFEDNDG